MVSIVIPTYNRGNLIAETIQSILDQTFKDLEIIVIDDGSTDNTREVVEKFGDRVRYVAQQNSERAVSRNHGLRLSRGEFIAFPDSDDCWLPNTLAEMVEALRRVPAAGLVTFGCAIVDDKRHQLGSFVPGGTTEGVVTNGLHQLLRANIVGSPSEVLLRRSVLDRTGAFDEDRKIIGIEDWELWARMSFHCPIVCRRKLLIHYRRHGGNFPLAGIRLRYPRMIEALLRNLPLTEAQRIEVLQISAQRLVEYAEELIVLKELQAARYCLDAAANFHPPVADGEMFHQLLTRVPASAVPQK